MPVHHLMVGTWTPPGAIFTFEFNTETLDLKCIKKTEIPHDEAISWMTLSHDRKALYGAATKKWTSFSIKSPTEITQTSSHPMVHHPQAASSDTNTRAIFLLAGKKAPYSVYANPFYKHADHLSVFTTDQAKDQTLSENIQNQELVVPQQDQEVAGGAGIHGSVFDNEEGYLYSADMGYNGVWVHKKKDGSKTGEIEEVAFVPAPGEKDKPRWVEISPSNRYLYVLMEKGNRLCEFEIEPTTRIPKYTNREFPLIPPGIPNRWTMYRSDVCFLTSSGKYLFATSRANSFDLTGYIAAFRLEADGRIERQLFLNPTPTSGGHSNAVSPCPWGDEWVAITDDQEGWLEIYRWQEEFLGRVARCRVQEPGFGMNAVWYD